MIAGMKAMRLEASDAESSRVDARQSTVVGDASTVARGSGTVSKLLLCVQFKPRLSFAGPRLNQTI